MKIEYRLKALDSFVCLGPDCPANCCCAGWRIDVDPDIPGRWEAIPDPDERARLMKAIAVEDRDGKPALRIATDESGCCPLLTADRLCSVQQRHGEEWLPTVCRTYPRAGTETATHTISTASLSCPEIARKVLLESAPGEVFRASPAGKVPVALGEDRIRVRMGEILDRVMAETKYTVATRAYYLADLTTRLSRLALEGRLTPATLEHAAASCKTELFETGVAIKERRLRADPQIGGSFWFILARNGFDAGLLPAAGAASALAALLDAPAMTPPDRYAAVYRAITELRAASQPQVQRHEPQLCRYLHASLVYNGFPLRPAFDNYIISLMGTFLPAALIKLRLWLLAATQDTITDADVVSSVYLVERRIAQSQWALEVLNSNPRLMELDRYHAILVDL